MAIKDKYLEVTEKIIEQLESGTIPWRKPWSASVPRNLFTGKEYRGIDNNIDDGQAAAYIKSWLNVLKDDPKMVWKAASQAQKAADFVMSSGAHLKASEEDQL